MRNLLYFFLFLCVTKLHGQGDSLAYRVISTDSISNYYIFENAELIGKKIPANLSYSDKKRKKYSLLYMDNKPIDSTGLYFLDVKFINGIQVGRKDNSTLYRILNQQPSRLQLNLGDSSIIREDINNYYIIQAGKFIYEMDFNTGERKMLADMSRILCASPPCYGLDDFEGVTNVWAINKNKYIIQTCVQSDIGPGCEFVNYYLFERMTEQIKNVADKIKAQTDQSCKEYERSSVFITSSDNQFIRWYTTKTHDFCEKDLRKSWVTDSDLNFKSEVLHIGRLESLSSLSPPVISGMVVKNENVSLYYLNSRLDDSEVVLVPYKFISQLEICMFNAFNGAVLTKDELKGFGKYELGILRYLIFAKHNYGFTNAFYKAYFNLYSFYNNKIMRVSRVKNIDRKLTEADKKNITLIQALEK